MLYWKLILLFVLIPVIELAGLWIFSLIFNFFFTVLLIICISAFGVFLAKRQGTNCWIELNRQLDNGEVPRLPIMHGMLILIAATLLIVPGLLSDFLGILLLFPFVRTLIIDHFTMRFENYRQKTKNENKTNEYENSNNYNKSDNIIDI
ncbi:MAG: FxsA family protein [Planctomycetaceae bacterium]|jgi:UPF0716 protein FxsA|nr:FxsA family protein [Planctomycetaceae bacterium]